MQFLGANPAAQVVGLDPLASHSTYLMSSNPAAWRTDVPNFARVAYQDLYPGVSLVFYGNQQKLEYDLAVAPGADPSAIHFAITGTQGISLDAQGNLLLHTTGSDVVEQAPVIYQELASGRQTVAGRYVLGANGDVSFAVDSYDTSRPLVIDPVLSYSTYLGGTKSDIGKAIAVDSAGNAYVVGQTFSPDFPTAQALQPTGGSTVDRPFAGQEDLFIAKLNASGTALLYSTYLGGTTGSSSGQGIAVDAAGNVYVTGSTAAIDFPTVNPLQAASGGLTDAFLVKLDPTGSALVYSTYLGGSGSDVIQAIAVDAAGNAYITGNTTSVNFPTLNALQPTDPTDPNFPGMNTGFVAKVNVSGTALVYATHLGGHGFTYPQAIATDAAGSCYVTGYTTSDDFPLAHPLQATPGGNVDAFVTKLNADGSALVYSTYLGGVNADEGHSIAVDEAGNAYVTGSTTSFNFPTVNALQAYPGGTDVFVAKLNASGSALDYSTFLGGADYDTGVSIAVDSAGNAYIVGSTSSKDFRTTHPIQPAVTGVGDAFVVKLNAVGSALLFSTFLGGSSGSSGNGIAVDGTGNVYIIGTTSSPDFPTVHPIQPGAAASNDVFVTKINLASTSPGQLQLRLPSLTSSSLVVDENAGSITLTVSRTNGIDGTVSVHYSVGGGTAHAGTQYVPTSGTLTFGPGETSKTFTVILLSDPTVSGPQTVDLTLSDPGGGALLGDPSTAVLTIVDEHSNDDLPFVTNLYRDFLGRDPETGGLNYWLNQVDVARLTYSDPVVTGFLWTAEARSRLVSGYITQYLGRPAAPGEDRYYADLLTSGTGWTPERVIAEIVASDEYSAKYGSDNARWLDQAYQDLLGHGRDDQWQGYLDVISGPPFRAAVAMQLMARSEYKDALITAAYVKYLGRQPNSAELAIWEPSVGVPPTYPYNSANGDDWFVAQVLHSREYWQRSADSGPVWVANLYGQVLGRVPEGDGSSYWINQLMDSYIVQRQQVAVGFLTSDEYRGRLVNDYFTSYLHRPATPGEIATYVDQLKQGAANAQVLAAILGSDEYYQRQGGTNAGWLNQAYLDLFGRIRRADETIYLDALNNQTMDRVQVALALATSREYQGRLAADFFAMSLMRQPTFAETSWVVDRMANYHHTEEDVLSEVLNSTERFLLPMA
jgi:hypothetical protein